MAIPRPPKKLKLLPSVRVSDGPYIAVLEFLAINKDMTLGELDQQSYALHRATERDSTP